MFAASSSSSFKILEALTLEHEELHKEGYTEVISLFRLQSQIYKSHTDCIILMDYDAAPSQRVAQKTVA